MTHTIFEPTFEPNVERGKARLRERVEACVASYRDNQCCPTHIDGRPVESVYAKALEWIGDEAFDPAKARGLDDLRLPCSYGDIVRHLQWRAAKEARAAEAAPQPQVTRL